MDVDGTWGIVYTFYAHRKSPARGESLRNRVRQAGIAAPNAWEIRAAVWGRTGPRPGEEPGLPLETISRRSLSYGTRPTGGKQGRGFGHRGPRRGADLARGPRGILLRGGDAPPSHASENAPWGILGRGARAGRARRASKRPSHSSPTASSNRCRLKAEGLKHPWCAAHDEDRARPD